MSLHQVAELSPPQGHSVKMALLANLHAYSWEARAVLSFLDFWFSKTIPAAEVMTASSALVSLREVESIIFQVNSSQDSLFFEI